MGYTPEVMLCGHCNNKGPMEIAVKETRRTPVWVREDSPSPLLLGHEWAIYEVLKCYACSEPTIRRTAGNDICDHPDDRESIATTLYPHKSTMHPSVPENIGTLYEMGLIAVKRGELATAGFHFRRVLSSICTNKGLKSTNLCRGVNKLAEQLGLPKVITDIAHSLRHLGNISVHEDPTEEEIVITRNLCDLLLVYVYQAPALLQEAEGHLAARKETAVAMDAD